MVKVEVCIGSACYVKGANQVIQDLMTMIEENNWKEKVELKGCFCMKSCENHSGLGIRVNGETLTGITAMNAKEILKEKLTQELA